MAVHAPFGSMIQTSASIPDASQVNEGRSDAPSKHQLLVSCKRRNRPVVTDRNDDQSPLVKRVRREGDHDGLRVYFLPEGGQGRSRVLQDDPILKLIEEPAYTSDMLDTGGAGDSFHVSCLKEDEGVSSFF
jgi:hypothetical protein